MPGAGAKPPRREVYWTAQADQDREHITGEHRLVYRVEGNTIFIAQCRFHYD